MGDLGMDALRPKPQIQPFIVLLLSINILLHREFERKQEKTVNLYRKGK